MSNAREVNQARKVTVAARVEPSLADAVVALADRGNRSTSREIAAAIAEHVSKESAPAAATTSSAIRSSAPPERGEACASPLAGKRSSPGGDYFHRHKGKQPPQFVSPKGKASGGRKNVQGPAPRPGGNQPPSAQGDYLIQQE